MRATRQVEVGDHVQWTHVALRGRTTITMTLREGVVEDILPGGIALVRKRKRGEHVALCRLRHPEQESQVSEFVAVTQAAAGRHSSRDPQ